MKAPVKSWKGHLELTKTCGNFEKRGQQDNLRLAGKKDINLLLTGAKDILVLTRTKDNLVLTQFSQRQNVI